MNSFSTENFDLNCFLMENLGSNHISNGFPDIQTIPNTFPNLKHFSHFIFRFFFHKSDKKQVSNTKRFSSSCLLSPPSTNHQFTCIMNKNESKKRKVIVIVVTRFVISHCRIFTASILWKLLLMSRKV